MKSRFLGVVAVVVSILAIASASTASTWLWHQPKAPRSLQ